MLLSLVLNSWHHDPPALVSQRAGITGMSHGAQPLYLFCWQGSPVWNCDIKWTVASCDCRAPTVISSHEHEYINLFSAWQFEQSPSSFLFTWPVLCYSMEGVMAFHLDEWYQKSSILRPNSQVQVLDPPLTNWILKLTHVFIWKMGIIIST